MSQFETTRWSLVMAAAGCGTDARAALESLCRTYRLPVLAYVRRHVHSREMAEDLTQAFFLEFIEGALHARADPTRGRFRAYLLTAVKRFLIDQHVGAQRLKRGGGINFESIDPDGARELAGGDSPEAVFERDWALAALAAALARLRAEAAAAGKLELFEHLHEFLTERPADADYARVADALHLRRNTLAVAVHRLRQRLRELVRAEVGETTGDAETLHTELRSLRSAFASALGDVR